MSRFPIAPKIAVSKLFRGSTPGSSLLVGREEELKALDDAWSGTQKKNVVTIVAWGGVGKTSLVARWAANTLAKENHVGIESYFDWSFYSQGTRTEGDATGADKAASADIFVREALEFFGDGDLAASNAGAWQKGERLARLISEHRNLLILDGLEPLQEAKSGDLQDYALRALLRGLAVDNRGLCVVTTRQQLPELNTWHETTAPEWRLAKLSKEAGAELLKNLGVKGTPSDREQLAEDVKGHALTLTLLGKYLAEAHDGDIRKRDLVSLSEADYEETRGHAFHVMEAYERWLEKDCGRAELAIMRLTGLFDRPATPDCLAALRQAPVITGLTDVLVPLNDAQWNLAAKRLVQLGLVEEQLWEPRRVLGYSEEEANNAVSRGYQLGEPSLVETSLSPVYDHKSLDAHPLIREYFGWRLRDKAQEAWREAHSRLFGHLRGSVPYWPEGLDGLQPLYQAITHGCHAGRYQEACDEVFRGRIVRNTSGPHAFFSSRKLGAMGADLAAIGCFFVAPWTRPAEALSEEAQAWLLSLASYRLQALGRLTEAREPVQVSIDAAIREQNWESAAVRSGNLSGLDLTLGDVATAVREAEQSVSYAELSGKTFQRITKRAKCAYTLHQAGRAIEAREQFEESEAMQRETQPNYPFLYSLQGFWFCDLLLADAERVAAQRALWEHADSSARLIGFDGGKKPLHREVLQALEQRATHTLEWGEANDASLLDIALNHLTLGRAVLYGTVLEPSLDRGNSELAAHINAAVNGFRQYGDQSWISASLLTRAWLWVMLARTAEARRDLDEAQQIAERGPMRLHLADVHLYRARLFFREDLAAAREDLKQARLLIEKCGYLRRMPELEDAEKVILAVQ